VPARKFAPVTDIIWSHFGAYAEPAHVGKVRQTYPTRRVRLGEYDLALGTVHGSPLPDPPLERPADAVVDPVRMPALQLVQYGDRSQTRCAFNQRYDLFVLQSGQRIGAGPVIAGIAAR